MAAAKAACESRASIAACYVSENKKVTNGLPFGAYTTPDGTIGYTGPFPDSMNYAGLCSKASK